MADPNDSFDQLICGFTWNGEHIAFCRHRLSLRGLDRNRVYSFFFPPIANYRDLYPLIPTGWSGQSWQGLLFIWSAFSGPVYLVFMVPWLSSNKKYRNIWSLETC